MTRAIIGGVGLGKQLGVVFIPFIFPPHFSFSFFYFVIFLFSLTFNSIRIKSLSILPFEI